MVDERMQQNTAGPEQDRPDDPKTDDGKAHLDHRPIQADAHAVAEAPHRRDPPKGPKADVPQRVDRAWQSRAARARSTTSKHFLIIPSYKSDHR